MSTFPYDAIYSYWSDELARQATITLQTGTAEAGYGVDRLIDDNPAILFKSPDTQVALQIAFGAPVPLALLALFHATPEAGEDVRIQGHTSAAWGSPSVDLPFPPAGWVGAGVTRWPNNPWLSGIDTDLFDVGYRYYRLCFGLTTPLAQPLQLGQLRMHSALYRYALDNSPQVKRTRPRIDNRTAFNISTKYSRGTEIYSQAVEMGALEDDERTALQAHWSDVDGANQPWVFIPDGLVNRAYLGTWAMTDESFQRMTRATAKFTGAFEELGRGLRPGT